MDDCGNTMKKSFGISDFIGQTLLYGVLFGAVISKGKMSTNPLVWIFYGIGGWAVALTFIAFIRLIWKSVGSIRKRINEAKAARS
jgi:hypothetical protein